MNKNTKNKGFSIVELIVTITVISVLTGVLVPMFGRYLNTRRQMACRANREALLNIYEKAVYDDQLLLDQDDLEMVINASGSKMTTEYTNQASDYLICPQANAKGHFLAYVDGTNAYIVCDQHTDDVCMMSFDNWIAKADLTDPTIDEDPAYEIPAPEVDPTEGTSDPEEVEEPPVDTTETVNTGIWPRIMDSLGRLDERWAAVGAKPGNSVTINGPVHFIDITGVEIVIVYGPYTVKYEDAAYPLGHGANALPGVVAASGVKYSESKMPVQVEIQGQGHYEYVPHYDTVEFKGTVKTTYVQVYKDCYRSDCKKRNKEKHNHSYFQVGPENWRDFDKCPLENCKKKNAHSHDYWSNEWSGYETVETKEYVGPDCKINGCKDRYVKDHTHQIENGTDKKWVPGETSDVYRVNYGDMLELNGVTYIYAENTGGENYVYGLPEAGQTAMGANYNGWYVVPALTTK